MQKVVGALTDYKTRTEVDLETGDTSVDVQDYEDNGITVGDRIELRSRILEKVWKTDDGTGMDVGESYITPEYRYSVSDASEAGWFRDTVASADHGSDRWVEHDTGVWFKPARASQLPAGLRLA
jgi:hypothetical protein